jgi:hypothetical protein
LLLEIAQIGCSKEPSNKATGDAITEAYPLGYVEDIAEPRTKLGALFSILYSFHLHESQFDWSGAAEDAHEHFDAVMVGIDLIH